MIGDVLIVSCAYLLGSVPWAFLIARRHGVDVRRTGSGSAGATNVLRTVGVWPALMTLALDVAKGALAVAAAVWLASSATTAGLAALGAVVGHVYPPWLGFHGGKGVATAAGAFAGLLPGAVGAGCVAFAVAVLATRYVSVGSLAATVTFVAVAAAWKGAAVVKAAAMMCALIVVASHRENLSRLRAGREPKVGAKGPRRTI